MIGIIGFGKMGKAIVHALIKKGFEVLIKKKETKNLSKILTCDIVFLCVKPKDIIALLHEIRITLKNKRKKRTLFISIVAGKTISSIECELGAQRIVRAMPNLAVKTGKSITCYCANAYVTHQDLILTEKVFSSFGVCVQVKEKYLDAITALSGSGPAYYFYFTQKLAQAGEKIGLPRKIALFLAKQTLFGASSLVENSDKTLEEMICEVATPNGTTEAALTVFEKENFSTIVKKALTKAEKRGKKLSTLSDAHGKTHNL